jgi:drug/metabolite transporter (DMT)-like permease
MLEVAGNVLGVLGLIFAGSGLFQVVYSSVVLFTALLSKIFLRRSPQTKQWIALFLIVFGLALSALGGAQGSSSGHKSTVEHERDQIRSTMIGVGLTMLCATLYASSYISVEWILQDAADPPSQRDLQAYAGLYGLSIIMVYTLLHTIPNWSVLVVANVESKNGSLTWVYACYILIALSGFFHSVSYYKLVASVGAVSTGVLQSLRAVSVFGISSIAFCSHHSEQCVNGPKIISMVVVAIGLTAYSHWAAPKKCESPS